MYGGACSQNLYDAGQCYILVTGSEKACFWTRALVHFVVELLGHTYFQRS